MGLILISDVDEEDDIITAGPDISPTPPSTRNLSYNTSPSKAAHSGLGASHSGHGSSFPEQATLGSSYALPSGIDNQQNIEALGYEKENINPNMSLPRLQGDGGPSFELNQVNLSNNSNLSNGAKPGVLTLDKLNNADPGQMNVVDKNRLNFSADLELLENIQDPTPKPEVHPADVPIVSPTTDTLYAELNKSLTPELPATSRHRSVLSNSRDSTPAPPTRSFTLEQNSADYRIRSPSEHAEQIDELHRSLNQFDELVHSIHEAAQNISSRSRDSLPGLDGAEIQSFKASRAPGSNEQLTPHRKLQFHSTDESLEGAALPDNLSNATDLASMSARVIEVQNGTFTEFMETSPEKRRVVNLNDLPRLDTIGGSTSFSLTTQNDIFDSRLSPRLSHTLPSKSPPAPVDTKALSKLDKETESIIARYQKLKMSTSGSITSSSQDKERPLSGGDFDRRVRQGSVVDDVFSLDSSFSQQKTSPSNTSPLNKEYLQETPNKIKVRRLKKVSLAFEDGQPRPLIGVSPTQSPENSQITGFERKDDGVFKVPRTPPKSARTTASSSSLVAGYSPFTTPTRQRFNDGNSFLLFKFYYAVILSI